MEPDHSVQGSPSPQPASPRPASPQPDPVQSASPQPDPVQSTSPQPAPAQPASPRPDPLQLASPQPDPLQSTSPQPDSSQPEPPNSDQPPRPRRPRHDSGIQAIRYKRDPHNPERFVRKHLEYVLPNGDTWREPFTGERTAYERVEMEPERNGQVWMSRRPIDFVTPLGRVVPYGKDKEQTIHIMLRLRGREPIRVMPHLFSPSQSQPPANHDLPMYPLLGPPPPVAQPLLSQPLPALNQQQFSADGSYPQPHSINAYQPPQDIGALEAPFQAEPMNSVGLSNGLMGTVEPVRQADNHQVGGVPFTPQANQIPQEQGRGGSHQPPIAQQGAYQHVPVPNQALDQLLDFMNVQGGEFDPNAVGMENGAQFPGGEDFGLWMPPN